MNRMIPKAVETGTVVAATSPPDLETRIRSITATRPPSLRGYDNPDELVAWAITALEGQGIYPGLKRISQLFGGHIAQRDLEPLVSHFYEQRRPEQDRKSKAQDVNHLDDLYQLVLAHAREEVRKQLEEEFRALHEEADRLDQRKQAIDDEKAEVAHQRELVDEVRRMTAAEMELMRADQKLVTDRIEASAAELAAAEVRIASQERSLAASEGARGRLLAQVERATAAIQRLTTEADRMRAMVREGIGSREDLERRIQTVSADLHRERSRTAELQCLVSRNQAQALGHARKAKSVERMCRIEAGRADRYRGLSILRQQELRAASAREAGLKKMLRIAQQEKQRFEQSSALVKRIMRANK